MYNERRIRQSELLQLLLLDTLYSLSGSEHIIFQGGTALRWVYSGVRFSEDLDFVTQMSMLDIQSLLAKMVERMKNPCIAQFGPGQAEVQPKTIKNSSLKTFFVYRPRNQRERIAVKLEFERLADGVQPDVQRLILRDWPQVPGLMSTGQLVLPYTSSIVVVETVAEILSDKIRALFERKYIKGRDVYDIWWLWSQLGVRVSWPCVQKKLTLYQVPFTPARNVSFFQDERAAESLTEALMTDLPRFLPPDILKIYQDARFQPFIQALRQLTTALVAQGMVFEPPAMP